LGEVCLEAQDKKICQVWGGKQGDGGRKKYDGCKNETNKYKKGINRQYNKTLRTAKISKNAST